jgi:glycosyltransferase involved in cell wall biosynthesis
MNKKNIGILFSVSRKMGVFQYGLSIAECLVDNVSDFDYTMLYFGNENPKEFFKLKNSHNLEKVNFVSLDPKYNNFWGKVKFALNILFGKPIFITNKFNNKVAREAKIDLLIIPFPLLFGFENKIPYIVSIPDAMFKYYPGFPEYSFKNQIKDSLVYGSSIKHSILSVVDSEYGKEDLVKFFKTPSDKIKPITFIPPGYVYKFKDMSKERADSLLSKYNLPEKFIFYPAQFWFHKNHIRLVEAMGIIKKEKGAEIPLVLVGDKNANYENYKKIMALAENLGIEKQIMHLGYVADEEVVALYKKSLALVFCTLIGPTSIPPLEAMLLGTPVLCSNLFGMPEEVGDAGVLFGPFNPADMAEKIYSVWTDENKRKQMIQNGFKMAEKITPEAYTNKWKNVIKEALQILQKQ